MSHHSPIKRRPTKKIHVGSVAVGGASALHSSAMHGDVEGIAVLVRGGAAIDVADGGGWTPLHWAARCGQHGCW